MEDQHSVPAMSEPDLRTTLRRSRDSPALARSAVRRLLTAAATDPKAIDSVELVVSELVTNACKYGQGEIELRLALRRDRIGVEVIDQGCGPTPAIPPPGSRAVGGWGLHVVSQLACSWGAQVDGGTDLWAWLPARPGG